MSICVALGLPLMLFSSDIKGWLQLAPRTLIALGSAITAVVLCSFLAGILFCNDINSVAGLVGLNIALYVGGTPNLAALKDALAVNNNQFLQLHLYDTLVSAGYLMFVTSVAQRLFLNWLPAFSAGFASSDLQSDQNNAVTPAYHRLLSFSVIKTLIPAILLAMIIIACAGIVASMFSESVRVSVTVVVLTFLGLLASFSGRLRRIPHTFDLGMYIILVFCVIVGSMINSKQVAVIDSSLLMFVLVVVFGSVLLHALVCALVRIDVDTFLVTSVATICSPPFVPMLAVALNNQQVVLSGMTAGIIGYALGGLLGIGFSELFQFLMHS